MTKRILSIIGSLALVTTLTPVSVTTSAAEMSCRIPFSFTVNGTTLPAGDYTFSTHDALMSVRGAHGGALVLTTPTGSNAGMNIRKAVFDRVGDDYTLREAWLGSASGLALSIPRVNPDQPRLASNAPVERVEIRGL